MKRLRRVTVLVDEAAIPDADPDLSLGELPNETEYHVVDALRRLGYEVSVLGAGDSVRGMVEGLEGRRPELVVNLTEEFRCSRRHDRNIAALLELMDLPYTGSGPLGLSLCRDKALCKNLLNSHRIRVPRFFDAPLGRRLRVPSRFPLPAVVKPLLGDGSDGISNASLVDNEERLRQRVAFVHERLRQTAIVEEYIAGRELYVGVLGSRRLRVLPPRELFLGSGEENGGPLLSTYHAKFDERYQERWGIRFGFAELEPEAMERLARICKRAYRVLRIRDYGRLDMRMTAEGRFVILEANANPDLAYGDELAESAERAGLSYRDLLQSILRSAWRRGSRQRRH